VVAHDVLVHSAGRQIVIAPPQFDVSLSGRRLRRRVDASGGYDPFRGLPFEWQSG
jgi:hypothetical protein